MNESMRCIKLLKTVNALNTSEFNDVLKRELEGLPPAALPLQEGMAYSSYTTGNDFQVIILKTSQEDGVLHVKAGVFYTGVIAGCNCADDPSPVEEQPEYCDLLFTIHLSTAETTVTLL